MCVNIRETGWRMSDCTATFWRVTQRRVSDGLLSRYLNSEMSIDMHFFMHSDSDTPQTECIYSRLSRRLTSGGESRQDS